MSATPPSAPVPLFTEMSARHLGPVRRFFVRRPGAMDAVVVLWFLLPAVLTARSTPESLELPADLKAEIGTWGLALALLGAVVLVWRRHRPVEVTAVMASLGVLAFVMAGSTAGFELGLALALYCVAASRSALVTWTTMVLSTAALLAAAWFSERSALVSGAAILAAPEPGDPALASFAPDTFQVWMLNAGAIVVFCLLAVAIGTSVRNRRLHVADLVDRANALARDRDQQARLARAAERARIAREMHDVVAHSVSVMIALGAGASAALDRSPDRSRAALDELAETGRSALADMRRVLGVLDETEPRSTPEPGGEAAPLDPQPGSTDLIALVERFRTAGLPVRATGLGQGTLPPDTSLQLAVYRIVQEGLTNALRYAGGTAQVDLAVRRTAVGVEIELVDQGPAVPVAGSHGAERGLIGMRERAAVYGGTVAAGPYAHGWRVLAVLPWEEGT